MELKKKKKKKLAINKVQNAFNAAIRRRDCICIVPDYRTPCSGNIQASHFFPVGGNGCLRFYPFNCFGQCASHHTSHHYRDPVFYHNWMSNNYPDELEFMQKVRGQTLRYNQSLLAEIYQLCNRDELGKLAELIEEILQKKQLFTENSLT